MWRLIAVTSLVLTLALGSQASASPSCQICIESAQGELSSSTLTLRFTARAADGVSFPETGTAVVMRFDGQQSKCLNVTLRKTGQDGGLATYVGSFTAYSGLSATSKYDGRVDIGGNIHEFAVSGDAKPGTVSFLKLVDAPPTTAASAPTSAPATSAPTTAPTNAPQLVEPAPAPRVAGVDLAALTANPILLLGLAVIGITAISLFFERRRARIATA